MSPFLELFLLGCLLIIIIKGIKGKKITFGKVILWGLVFAILFPFLVPLAIIALVIVLTGAVVIGIGLVMVILFIVALLS